MYRCERNPVQLSFLYETPRGLRTHRGRPVAKMNFDEYDKRSKKKLDLLAEVAAIAKKKEECKASIQKLKFPFTGEMVGQLTTNNEPCDEGSCDEGTPLPGNFEELFPKECSQESTSSAVPVRSDGVERSPPPPSAALIENADKSIKEKTSELVDWIGAQLGTKSEKNTESSDDVDRGEENDNKSSGSTQPSTVTSKTWKSPYNDPTNNTTPPPTITPPRTTTTSDILSSRFWKAGPTLFKPQIRRCNDRQPFTSRKMRCNRQMRLRSALQNSAGPVPEAVVGITRPLAEENGFNVINKGHFRLQPLNVLTTHGWPGHMPDICVSNSVCAETPKVNPKWQELLQSSLSYPYGYRETIRNVVVPDINIVNVETSTVGQLRSMVCDALNSMFSDGFHVTVFYRGKKMTDDRQTLREAGLSNYHHDELRIKLEPNCSRQGHANQRGPPLTEKPLPRIPHASDAGAMSSSPLAMVVDASSPRRPYPYSLLTGVQSFSQSRQSSSSPVPFQRRRSNSSGERRARRPFTVAEVEALVRTVEELGTGRWRDVKNRAFAHSEHRTYVDLKDKWKTLVHTAELGAQQRRGEPVPQDLLNRVMATQTYWTNQTRLRNDNQIHIKDD